LTWTYRCSIPWRRELRERYGFHAHFSHFAIIGLCRACYGDKLSGE